MFGWIAAGASRESPRFWRGKGGGSSSARARLRRCDGKVMMEIAVMDLMG